MQVANGHKDNHEVQGALTHTEAAIGSGSAQLKSGDAIGRVVP